jgi:hypothetical protein
MNNSNTRDLCLSIDLPGLSLRRRKHMLGAKPVGHPVADRQRSDERAGWNQRKEPAEGFKPRLCGAAYRSRNALTHDVRPLARY